jgi:hypothetical protein
VALSRSTGGCCLEFLSILNIRFAFGHGGDHSNYEGSMMKPFYFPSTLLAGNMTTTNFSVTLDYLGATNPVVQLT